MASLKTLLIFLIGLGSIILRQTVAQSPADSATPLELFTPVTGQIEPGGQQVWSFTAPNGAIRSFQVQALTGDLDPAFSILSSSGNELIGNDDFAYPRSRDSLVEAITFPHTDTYTIIVTGVSQTSGEYRLMMTAGFAGLSTSEDFEDGDGWEGNGDSLTLSQSDGLLNLTLSGPDLRGFARPAFGETPSDYYAQVNIDVRGQDGWVVGLTAGDETKDSRYLLLLNNEGQWQFIIEQNEADRVIREWTPHPAIIAENPTFTLAILVGGNSFDFFYDGQFFGHVDDTALADKGHIGLSIATRSALTSQTEASFDNLVISTPILIDGKRPIPQQLVLSRSDEIPQELWRRGLTPGGGELALTVNESFVESRQPGVSQLLLGRGVTFSNFAFGTTVSWKAAAPGVTGCGLVFRIADESHYTLAYIDQTGSYGLSERNGDAFKPGLFIENKAPEGGSHRLVIVAKDTQLLYYVDGYYGGTLNSRIVDGSVGNAVVNFDPISTSCQFTDTWLWRWS